MSVTASQIAQGIADLQKKVDRMQTQVSSTYANNSLPTVLTDIKTDIETMLTQIATGVTTS